MVFGLVCLLFKGGRLNGFWIGSFVVYHFSCIYIALNFNSLLTTCDVENVCFVW